MQFLKNKTKQKNLTKPGKEGVENHHSFYSYFKYPFTKLGIRLWQVRSLGVDWDSFLRNNTFYKVSAQKDRNHCWIYFPSHSCLWDWCKPCSLINLPLRPLSFLLPLDPITSVFTLRDFFFLLLFNLIAITCQLAEHFLSLRLQDRKPA